MATRKADRSRGVVRAALALGAAALVAGSIAMLGHEATRDRIAADDRARRAAQLESLLGGLVHDNDLLADLTYVRDPDLLGTTSPVPVYRARLAGRSAAIVIAPVAPDGYAGSIDLLVAIRADGRVLGVRTTRHRETPGLGDAIDEQKSDWIRRFTGRALGDPPLERWKVRKDGGDFDQFTGATVTPRAVVRAVASSLQYFEQHRDELFSAPATMPP
jgi:Na+-translocating ferredoxin:NAD+ oxidoreductase subunit G